jgi:hypothetical protein
MSASTKLQLAASPALDEAPELHEGARLLLALGRGLYCASTTGGAAAHRSKYAARHGGCVDDSMLIVTCKPNTSTARFNEEDIMMSKLSPQCK